MTSQILAQETLKELLHYNPETGIFTWKKRSIRWFTDKKYLDMWNTRFAGEIAGTISPTSYRVIFLLDSPYQAHRLAFLYMTGELPPNETDHINGSKADNRWTNLRAATRSENMRNVSISKRNKSGKVGVCWYKATEQWHSRIQVHGETVHLGYFDEIEDAVAARAAAELKYGYHPNHGRAPFASMVEREVPG